jgi:hypothetical protein
MRASSCTAGISLVLFLGLALLAAVTGCGKSDRPELGTVAGTVTLDGRPLPSANVIFTPNGPGRTSLGVTDADGKYSLTYLRDIMGANLGRHYVRITTATEENGGKELLPAKCHANSELSADVIAGSNTFDFAVQSK